MPIIPTFLNRATQSATSPIDKTDCVQATRATRGDGAHVRSILVASQLAAPALPRSATVRAGLPGAAGEPRPAPKDNRGDDGGRRDAGPRRSSAP